MSIKRLFVGTHRIVGIAHPVQGHGRETALGIALEEVPKRQGRSTKLRLLHDVNSLIKLTLLTRLGGKLNAIQRNLDRFKLAQALIDASLGVALGTLRLRQIAGQLFVLPAQGRQLSAQLVDLIGQLQHAAALGCLGLRVTAVDPFYRLTRLLHLHTQGLNPLTQIQNSLAGFIVTEESVGGKSPGQCSSSQCRAQHPKRGFHSSPSAEVELNPAIAAMAVFAGTFNLGLFLAKAHCFHLGFFHTQQCQSSAHRFGTLLPQG